MVAYKRRQRAMSKKADKRPAACDLTAGRVRSDARADQGGGAFLQNTAPQLSLPCHHRAHCVALFDVTPRHLPPPQLGDHIQLASGRAGNPFLLKRERNAHIVALRHDPPSQQCLDREEVGRTAVVMTSSVVAGAAIGRCVPRLWSGVSVGC